MLVKDAVPLPAPLIEVVNRSGEKLFDNQESHHYLVFDQENRFSNGIEHCYYFRNAANGDS